MNTSIRPELAVATALILAQLPLFAASSPPEDSLIAATSAAGVRFDEEILVADITTAQMVVSVRGVHVAAVIPKGSRQAVVVDGAEGPRFDQIYSPGLYDFDGMGGRCEPSHNNPPNPVGRQLPGGGNCVMFNYDGTHYAYVGRSGNDLALMLNGQEVHRGPYTSINWLAFSPDGKRLIGVTSDKDGLSRVIVDGQAGPAGVNFGEVFFTPDGAHYAYVGHQNDAQQTPWMVVDGRQVKHLGEIVGFTSTGTLLTRTFANYNHILLANGKPLAQGSDFTIHALNGTRLIMQVTPPLGTPPRKQPTVLTVDGQTVPGAEDVNVMGTWLSPDGKRYAVLCKRYSPVMEAFMIVDGKKELNYQDIWVTDPYKPSFSPDSSKFLYVARSANGQQFVVVNGEESDGMASIVPPIWSPAGSRLAWGGTTSTQKQLFYLDGKLAPLPKNQQPGATFRFSPDGAHTSWAFGNPNALTLVVDGVEIPDVAGLGFIGAEAVDGQYVTLRISPDGKHTVYKARDAQNIARDGMWVDGKLITPSTLPQMNRVMFTPDSQHVAWAVYGQKNNLAAYRVFFDGREVLSYESTGIDNTPGTWEMGADGTLTLLGVDDGALKRYRIPPPPDSSITTMLAAAGGAANPPPAVAAAPSTPSTPPPPSTTRTGKPVDPAAIENLNRINDERAKRGQKPLDAPGYTYVPPEQRTAAPAPSTSPAPTGQVSPPVAAAPVRELRWIDVVNRPEFWPAQCTMKTTLQFNAGATVRTGQKVTVDRITASEVELTTLDGKIQFAAAPEETDVLAAANAEYAALTPAQRELTYTSLASRKDLWPYRVKITQTFDLGRGQRVQPGEEAVLLKFERGTLLVLVEKTHTTFNVVPQATDLLAQTRRFVAASDGAPSRVGTELEGKLVNSVTGRPDVIDATPAPRYYVFFRGSSTCAITRGFAPSLIKYYNETKAKHPEFEIVYIMTESPADTGAFAKELGFDWPAVEYATTAEMPVMGEPFGSLIPQLVVMDRAGNILANGVQQTAPAALQRLDALLNQPTGK